MPGIRREGNERQMTVYEGMLSGRGKRFGLGKGADLSVGILVAKRLGAFIPDTRLLGVRPTPLDAALAEGFAWYGTQPRRLHDYTFEDRLLRRG